MMSKSSVNNKKPELVFRSRYLSMVFSYKSKKIKLRPVQLSDKERSLLWRNDPEIRDMTLSYRYPITQEMEDSWYKRVLSGEDQSRVYFAIDNIEDDKHIGFIHLYNIDYIASNAYFGITIGDKSEHGKGKAREAIHLLVQFGFKLLNLHKINLEVASFNTIAIGLYRSFGFKTEGILKDQLFIDGLYHDKISMSIFRDEYYELYPEFRNTRLNSSAINKP